MDIQNYKVSFSKVMKEGAKVDFVSNWEQIGGKTPMELSVSPISFLFQIYMCLPLRKFACEPPPL